jgi:hypothetical protein
MLVEILRQLWALTGGSRGRPWSVRRQLAWLRFRMETYAGEGAAMRVGELVRFLRWSARERASWSRLD